MPNPIADPLVESVVSPSLRDVVLIDSSESGVVTLTINHPQTGNALSGTVAAALTEAFHTLHGADHVRAIFLQGAGGVFCAGDDASWLKTESEDWTEADLRGQALAVGQMLAALAEAPALTVALVEGKALGAGCALAAVCDLAVARADAQFGFPEVTTGAASTVIAPYVAAAIGARQAKALMATGRTFDAAEAQTLTLVHELAADDAGLQAIRRRIIGQALATGPKAVAETKRVIQDAQGRLIDHAFMEDTARRYARSRFSDEGREGLAASLEGRSPSWAER